MAIVVLAIAVQSDGSESSDDPSDEVDIKAIGTLIGMPFQLAAMALGGSLRLGDDKFSIALFAPPLLLTVLFVLAAYRFAQSAERRRPSPSTTERTILAASGALAGATVATVASRLLAMRENGAVMHAASIGLFFGVLTLSFVGGLLGRQSVHGSLWPRWLAADGRRAAHLVTQHVIGWVIVLVPISTIWLLVEDGPEAALFGVVWGPTVALGALALGHFGALVAVGDHLFVWELGWFAGVVLPVLALLFAVAGGLAWHLRRGNDRELLGQPVSWIPLPTAYGGAALAVCLLSTVGLSGGFYDVGGGITFHGAYWLIPVLAAWGAATELISRTIAPILAGRVPAVIATRLAKGPTVLVSPTPATVEHIPMSPADRARAKRALIVLGSALGLGLVGLIAVNIVGSSVFSPEKQAEAYLDALVAADVDRAVELAPVDADEASTALLTTKVYKAAGDRITGYDITNVEKHGGAAVVTVDLKGVKDGDDVELTLKADGRRGVLFRDWKVTDGGLAREVTLAMPDGSSALQVNDVEVTQVGDEEMDLWALPGSYAFDPYGDSKWLTPSDARTTVPASESYGLYPEIEDPQPSEDLKALVDSRIEGWVTDCMAATKLEPAECPQSTFGSGDKQRKVRWSLTTMPTVSWDSFDGTFPADLSSDRPGLARATYEYDASYGFGAPEWTTETDESTFYVSVSVDLVDGEPQVDFESY